LEKRFARRRRQVGGIGDTRSRGHCPGEGCGRLWSALSTGRATVRSCDTLGGQGLLERFLEDRLSVSNRNRILEPTEAVSSCALRKMGEQNGGAGVPITEQARDSNASFGGPLFRPLGKCRNNADLHRQGTREDRGYSRAVSARPADLPRSVVGARGLVVARPSSPTRRPVAEAGRWRGRSPEGCIRLAPRHSSDSFPSQRRGAPPSLPDLPEARGSPRFEITNISRHRARAGCPRIGFSG
jgi:hypothetical protein